MNIYLPLLGIDNFKGKVSTIQCSLAYIGSQNNIDILLGQVSIDIINQGNIGIE